MNQQDRQAIEQLFQRLADVEKTAAPRDADSEALIRDFIESRPQAAYYMAQTIIVQQQALEEAERRLEAGDSGGAFGQSDDNYSQDRPRSSGSGIPRSGARIPVPNVSDRQAQAAPQGGGGFLAGAAQTAIGVAGGVLIGSAIGSMLGMGASQPAQAAEPADKAEPAQEAPQEQTEMADAGAGADGGGEGGGFWDSLFGGGDGGGGGDFGGGDL